MEKAVLFNTQIDAVLGDCSLKIPLLWISSISVGILMSKLAFELMKASSPVFFPAAYRKLSDKDRLEWNNRAISTTHAIVSFLVAGYLFLCTDLFDEGALYGPVIFRSTIFSQFFLGVSNGYFLTDASMILWNYPSLGGLEYVIHHVISIISLFLAMHSGYAHIYLYMVLFSEITTPSINLRWYLAAADLKKTRAYITNGVVLFLSWLVARILLFAYLFTHVYFHFDEVRQIHNIGFYFVFISPPMFALMNLYWFAKIAKGLIKNLKAKDA